jgi:hypothetical protein
MEGHEEAPMSYQPPFDGNWMAGHPVWMTDDRPPTPVRAAVKLIYAGAVMDGLSVIVEIAAVHSRIPGVLATASTTPLTPGQQHTLEVVAVGLLIAAGIIGVSVWLWMASMNNAGRGWARILSSVLFAFFSVGILLVIAQPVTLEDKLLPIADWLVGLLAIVLLWQRESSDFFAARSHRY